MRLGVRRWLPRRVQQSGNAGIGEHEGILRGLACVDGRFRQHVVQQAAHLGHRIVQRDRDAGAQRVGDQHRIGVFGHLAIGNAHHQPCQASRSRPAVSRPAPRPTTFLADRWRAAHSRSSCSTPVSDSEWPTKRYPPSSRRAAQALDDVLLRGLVEIHHDVPAKNHVKQAAGP